MYKLVHTSLSTPKLNHDLELITQNVLMIYIDTTTNKKYIDSFIAYTFHLIDAQTIVLGGSSYVEISDNVIFKIEKDPHYEIQY